MRELQGSGLLPALHTVLGGAHDYAEIPQHTAFPEQLGCLFDDRLLLVYPGRLHTE